MSCSLRPHGLYHTVHGIPQARILEWVAFPFSRGSSQPRSPAVQVDSLPAEPQGKPKNAGVGSLSLLQRIFSTRELNWGLLHCRQILCQLSYEGSPIWSVSHVQPFVTPWTAVLQAFLFFTVSRSLLKFMSIESVMLSNHLILCHPLLLLPSIFPSSRVFSNESTLCIRWSKYWSFSISPSNEYSVLMSFRIDWFAS